MTPTQTSLGDARDRGGRAPRGAGVIVPEQERVIIDGRPHIVFVFTQMGLWIVLGLLGWGMLRWVGMLIPVPGLVRAADLVLVLLLVRFVFGFADWLARRHILTESRIVARFGILRTVTVDLPLRRVQHTMLVRPLAERIFGIGSIGITTAGTGGVDLVWRGVEHPERVLATIRSNAERMSVHGDGKRVTPVIGIVGGIGAGKSTVARAFERLGCVVSDSDLSVREIMSEPPVKARLVEWWGKGVLAQDGSVDRTGVAEIVFDSPFERRKLEGLIHPLVHQRRREQIARAIEDGAGGVVIDAPLLFEAGVDAECDAVVFVDTPAEIRRARVLANRGWDAQELDKREKAQLGLEHKRKRSDYVVANSGTPDELNGRAARVLASIRKDLQGRSPSD